MTYIMNKLCYTAIISYCMVNVFAFNNLYTIKDFFSKFRFKFQVEAREKSGRDSLKITIASLLSSVLLYSPTSLIGHVSAAYSSYSISNEVYKNVCVNLPSDDFWYPPFMIGKWDTTFKFLGATFSDKVY